MKGRSSSKHSMYKRLIGKTVLVPGQEFGVDVPELYYRARVIKKDRSHPGAVVVRFTEDNTLFWLPVDSVNHWLQEMESKGVSDTIGDAAQIFAAEVLASISKGGWVCPNPGAASSPASSGTYHAASGCGAPQSAAEPRVCEEATTPCSSQLSDYSVAALGHSSSDEEECSEAPSSLKRTSSLCTGTHASGGEVSQPRKRLRTM